jgi:flagellar hook-basal body complex protein FliE
MEIKSINNGMQGLLNIAKEKPAGSGFENIFSELIQDVNKAQLDSSKITQDYLTGQDVELHEVMIAGEKAKTSLDLLMEIRNKTIDMYKELTRTSI